MKRAAACKQVARAFLPPEVVAKHLNFDE